MSSLALVRLSTRKLIKISGPDCYPYLQGLLSNDVRFLYEQDRIPKREHAKSSSNVMASFILTPRGRAICDMLLYRTPSTKQECQFTPPGVAKDYDEILVECDSSLSSGLANTLYGYRVRRKIEVDIMQDRHVWSLFPKYESKDLTIEGSINSSALIDPRIMEFKEILGDQLTVVVDPRLSSMGLRIITNQDDFEQVKQSLQSCIDSNITKGSILDYHLHRYTLGVGEGTQDHPESNCLPLECNGDFLGMVSFNKGCYLGQELTARIYFTGVVRKRLMPIQLQSGEKTNANDQLPFLNGSEIIDAETGKKSIGTLRHVIRGRGLGLIRYELATKFKLMHKDHKTPIEARVPHWWNLLPK